MDTRELDQQKTAERKGNGAGKAVPDGTDVTETRPRPRRRIFFLIGAAIVLVLLLIWGVPLLTYMLSHEGTDDAHVAADEVAVTSKIPERINQILVDTNQQVHRGQLLIVLDNKDELARLRQAQAQYDLAIANQRTLTQQGQGGVLQAGGAMTNVQAQVPVAQDAVAQASAQLRAAQAQVPAAQQAYAKAQADYARISSLVGTGDVASQQLDAVRAQSAGAAAAAAWSARSGRRRRSDRRGRAGTRRRGSAGVAEASGAQTTAQGKLAQAADPSQVEAAKAQLYLANQSLNYTRIYASTDGYIGEKNVEVGQTIGAGITLLTIVPHRVYITANYKETQMGRMRVGQPADVRVDAYKGVTSTDTSRRSTRPPRTPTPSFPPRTRAETS